MATSKPPESTGAPERSSIGARLKALGGVARQRSGALAGWAYRNSARTLVALVTCGSLLAGMYWIMYVLVLERDPREELPTAQQILKSFDNQDEAAAEKMAARVLRFTGASGDRVAAGAYVLGILHARSAESAFEPNRTHQNLQAVRYLSQAHERGFPEGRNGEGLWHLGRSLYLGGRFAESRHWLEEALHVAPQNGHRIHALLAEVHLHLADPQLDAALEHNDAYVTDPKLSTLEQSRALLQRADILLRLGDLPSAREAIGKITSDGTIQSELDLITGRLALAEARAMLALSQPGRPAADPGRAAAKYEEAITALRRVAEHDTLENNSTPKAQLLIGTCYAEQNQAQAALAELDRVDRLHPDSPEALAANLAAADMLRAQDRPEDAITAYGRAIKSVRDLNRYSNPWVSLRELRERSIAAYQYFLTHKQFEQAVAMAQVLKPLVPPLNDLKMRAAAHRIWGEALLEIASAEGGSNSTDAEQGRDQLRQAGRLFYDIAQQEPASRSFTSDLWDSAQCLTAGQDYPNAAIVLREYLHHESRNHRPAALVALGQAYLTQDRVDEAIAMFEECMSRYPQDPATFQARHMAAQAWLWKGQPDKAEKLLLENIDGDLLTPSSKEWRDSLFALGRILYDTGRLNDCIRRLEEAVQRYPQVPEAIEGHYLIAEAYERLARVPRADLVNEAVPATRAALQSKETDLLRQAYFHYSETLESIESRPAERRTRLDDATQRNARLAMGGVLFDLGDYSAAIDVYSDVLEARRQSPIALEAYVQLTACYERLEKHQEARSALELAKVVLQRLPEDAPFDQLTICSRDEWEVRLNALDKLLRMPDPQ